MTERHETTRQGRHGTTHDAQPEGSAWGNEMGYGNQDMHWASEGRVPIVDHEEACGTPDGG
jgi:hypothetical protein